MNRLAAESLASNVFRSDCSSRIPNFTAKRPSSAGRKLIPLRLRTLGMTTESFDQIRSSADDAASLLQHVKKKAHFT